MDVVFLPKSLETIEKEFRTSYRLPREPDEFLRLVEAIGIKKVARIDPLFLQDEEFVKKLVRIDPCSLFYLGPQFHQDKYFREVTKHHEILLMAPLNKSLGTSCIHWIIDNCPEYVYTSFFKKPFPQLEKEKSPLRQRLGLGFLIKGCQVPAYLKEDVAEFKDKTKEELIKIKETILSYDKIETMLTYDKLADKLVNKKTKI